MLLSFFVVIASCKRTVSTGEHLPPKVMQRILLDINTAEAYCISVKDSLHRGGTKNMDSLSAYYKTIFTHYKITEAQFNESMNWYKSHPDEIDSLYNNIIPIATNWQTIQSKKTPATIQNPNPNQAFIQTHGR